MCWYCYLCCIFLFLIVEFDDVLFVEPSVSFYGAFFLLAENGKNFDRKRWLEGFFFQEVRINYSLL